MSCIAHAPRLCVAEYLDLRQITLMGSARVEQVMLQRVPTIAPTDTFRHAMSLMTKHRARHFPVVEGANVLGMVSIGDVVQARLDDLEVENNVRRDVYIATSHA